MNSFLKYVVLPWLIICHYPADIKAQAPSGELKKNFVRQDDLFGTRAFVENKGQFKEVDGQAVLFAFENGPEKIYFTNKGLIHVFIKYFQITEEQLDRLERGKEMREIPPEIYYVHMDWVNANDSVQIEKSDQQEHYLTYGEARYNSYPYKKITYKNLYNHIDVEYSIPADKAFGIKYNVILHPGAALEDIKMAYSGDLGRIKQKKNGDVIVHTPLEDITEHAPESFYTDGTPVASRFSIAKNIISFSFSEEYDPSKTIIIDPWLTTLTTVTSNNSGYDVDYDDNGNLFVYGGTASACKIAKFNSVGSLLWTFAGAVSSWNSQGISNFVVMKSIGKCYTGQGYAGGGATIIRLDASGNYDNLMSPSISSWNEVWDMAYHCSTGNVYGLGGSTSSNESAGILDPSTGTISPTAFVSVSTANSVGFDVVSHAIDDAGEFFWIYASSFTPSMSNKIARINAAFTSSVWVAASTFTTLTEYANKSSYSPAANYSNGFNCLAVNGNYLYYYDGFNVAAYDKSTGSIVASTTVQGQTAKMQGGIAVDDCDNVYLGGNGYLICYHFTGTTFSVLPSISLGISSSYQYVYDIQLNKLNKILYVSGSGFAGVYSSAYSFSCCTSTLTCAYSPPALSANNTSITCASLGSATVNPLGGPGPYTYTWLPSGQTGPVANGLAPGTHSVVVYDAGCNLTFTATTLLIPPIPLTGIVVSALPCNGINSGTAAITNLSGGSGQQNYLWTNGTNTQTTAIASGLGQGVYSVTVTDAITACVINHTFQLSWPPAQSVTVSQNTPSTCAGGSVSLLSNNSGGTPGYTYSWTPGPASAFYQASEPLSGLYVYTFTVKDANNCAISKTISVNFIGTPTLSTGNTSICPGQVGTLTVSGASTYTWNNGSTGNTFTANPQATSIYTVTGSGAICSSNATAAIVLKTIPSPTLTSNSPICNLLSLQLQGSGGASYLWSGPQNFTSTAPSPFIYPAGVNNSGVYSLTVSAANACTASISQTIVVNPSPVISVSGSTVCTTQTLQLTANGAAGYSYAWSGPNSFTSTLQNPSINTPSVSMSGIYQVLVTDANTCTNSASAPVSVVDMPIPTFTTNSPLCYGKILHLTTNNAGASLLYQWSGPNSFSSTLQNPQINAVTLPASGTYTLQLTDGPCIASLTHSVLVYPLPVLSVSGATNVCETKSLTLAISAAGPVVSYHWAGPAAFTSTSQSIVRSPFTFPFSGTYSASVTDSNTCSNTATILVDFLPNPVLTAPLVTVCIYQPAILHVSGATSYSWTGANGFQYTGADALIDHANLPYPVFYTVTGTAANSCTSATSVKLVTKPLPLPVFNILPDKSVCLGTPVVFTGDGGAIYQWRGPNDMYYEGKSLRFNAGGIFTGGIYTLTVTDSLGCKASMDTLFTIRPLPTGSLQKNNPQNCVPLSTSFLFTASGSTAVKSSWQINNDLFSGTTFSYCFKSEGPQIIKGMLYDTLTTCSNTVAYSILVYPKPKADFNFIPDKPVENDDAVQFTNTSQGDALTEYTWFFMTDDGYSSTSKNTSYLFQTEGQYPVAMVVKNTWGCLDTAIKVVKVDPDFSIYVPNVFTPNEDGHNDVFLPVIRTAKAYHLDIFDRWGELLFQTDDTKAAWDGKYKGAPCKSDVYVWKISLSTPTGDMKKMTGNVTLYR